MSSITDVELAFSTDKLLPAWEEIPQEFKDGNLYTHLAEAIFDGRPLPGLAMEFLPGFEDAEAPAALNKCVRAHLQSFSSKHQHKIAGVGKLHWRRFSDLRMQGRDASSGDRTGSVGEAYKGRTVGATGRLDERRPDGTVTCYSLAGFRELRGELDVAVISIADDGRCEVESSGWGAMLRVRFTDVEFDEEYLKVWTACGWPGWLHHTDDRKVDSEVCGIGGGGSVQSNGGALPCR